MLVTSAASVLSAACCELENVQTVSDQSRLHSYVQHRIHYQTSFFSHVVLRLSGAAYHRRISLAVSRMLNMSVEGGGVQSLGNTVAQESRGCVPLRPMVTRPSSSSPLRRYDHFLLAPPSRSVAIDSHSAARHTTTEECVAPARLCETDRCRQNRGM